MLRRAWMRLPRSCADALASRRRVATASATSASTVVSGAAFARRARPDRAAGLQGRRRRVALDQAVRDLVRLDTAWNPVDETVSARSTFIYGTAISRVVALLFAGAARDRDRAVPERARANGRPGRHRVAGRDARRDPERHARALGDPRARAVCPEHLETVSRCFGSAGHRSSAGRPARRRLPARDDRADDHDHPDQREHQPRAVPERADRAEGGRLRPRPDALGDGARRRLPVHSRRNRRCGPARDGTRPRRGDRRHAGDRQSNSIHTSWFESATRWRAASPTSSRARATTTSSLVALLLRR